MKQPGRAASARGLRLVTVALAAGLAGGACSDDPPPSRSARSGIDLSSVRACELLTLDEIESATGVAAAAGQDVSAGGGRLPMCNWPRAGSDFDIAVNVLVTESVFDDYDEFVARSRDGPFGDLFNEADVERVDGIGEFGVWMRELMMLQVHDGGVMVQVDAGAAAGRDKVEVSKTLARAVLERLR